MRKQVAERLYVFLLSVSVEDGALGPEATAEGVERACAALTETAWDAPLESLLAPRDALYPLLGAGAPPEGRMGDSADDRAMARGEASGAAGGGGGGGADKGEDYSSYGALFRESGY